MRVSSSLFYFTTLLCATAIELSAAKGLLANDALLHYLSGRHQVSQPKYRRRDAGLNQIPPRSIELSPRAPLPQRPSPGGSGEDQQGDGDDLTTSMFDELAFNSSATTACSLALDELDSVVNPSGMAACYNVPFFDNSTGTFVADIRLFMISRPVDTWVGIPIEAFTLEVQIPQATLSEPKQVPGKRPGEDGTDDAVVMLHEFQHVGQLNPQLQLDKLTLDDLRILLIPNITIAAPMASADGITTTTLSSDTLSYVAGLMTDPATTPTNVQAINITLPDASRELPRIIASATAFVLPGTTLGVFPLGLIVACIWTGVFVGVVGYGTWERMQFRNYYYRRMERSMNMGAVKMGSMKMGAVKMGRMSGGRRFFGR